MSCSGRPIRRLECGTVYVGELPEGCQLCHRGAKMVLFITGLCNRRCWYCPISYERRGRDVVYANEVRVRRLEEIVEVAEQMDAEGTGITGGEPLMVPERLLEAIRLLKRRLGGSHHIHLYTNGILLTKAFVRELKDAGLDEIRFHPVTEEVLGKLRWTVEAGIVTGIEVPAIPGRLGWYLELVRRLEEAGGEFLNLNELEFSETNALALRMRGLRLRPGSQVAADGSEEVALEVVRWGAEHASITIHYCPASVKDSVQLRRRLLRVARKVARPCEEVTEDGLLRVGILEGEPRALAKVALRLPAGLAELREDGALEFHPRLLEDVLRFVAEAGVRPRRLGIALRHPVTRLELEFQPASAGDDKQI